MLLNSLSSSKLVTNKLASVRDLNGSKNGRKKSKAIVQKNTIE